MIESIGMKFKIAFVLLFLIIFSGCNTFGGERSGNVGDGPDVVTRGDGLRVDVKIDREKIHLKQVNYVITLTNNGRFPIEITPENVKLTTLLRNNEAIKPYTSQPPSKGTNA